MNVPSNSTYTVCQLRPNAQGRYDVANKEHMNNVQEMRDWVDAAYGRFATIRVTNDVTGEVRTFTDDGKRFARTA